MNQYEYLDFDSKFADNLVAVGDIENDGNPTIVCYYNTITHRFYVALLVDNEISISRWIFIRVQENTILDYMNKDISLKDLVSNRIGLECYLFDRENESSTIFYLLETFPEDYIPVGNYFFEEEWCNENSIIIKFLQKTSAERLSLLPDNTIELQLKYHYSLFEDDDIIIDSSNRYAFSYSYLV